MAVAGVEDILEQFAWVMAALGCEKFRMLGIGTSKLIDGGVQTVGQVVGTTQIQRNVHQRACELFHALLASFRW